MSEFKLIELLRQRMPAARKDVHLGIGDDGALLMPPAEYELVVSTDTLVVGVHFPNDTKAEDIGWKSLAVNLSDMAAMGAAPAWALLALTMPTADVAFVEGFIDGFSALANLHDVALVGGDTTKGPLSITITMIGFVPIGRAICRKGARVGDHVLVTGTLGDAAAGLRCLTQPSLVVNPLQRDLLLARLNRPTPRIAAGLALRHGATACIDVSDGLFADLGHIAQQSQVGIEINASLLPSSASLLAAFDEPTRRQLQLAGGDDYELAFTVPPHYVRQVTQHLMQQGCNVTCIGEVIAGAGVRVVDARGNNAELSHLGWEHFR